MHIASWFISTVVGILALIAAFKFASSCAKTRNRTSRRVTALLWTTAVIVGYIATYKLVTDKAVPIYPWHWFSAGYIFALSFFPFAYFKDEE